MISIKNAARDELYEVSVFLNLCWKAEYSGLVEPDFLGDLSDEKRHEALLGRFDEGTSDFFVMRDGDELIGAAAFGKSYTGGYLEDGEISAIYLRRDYIGKGCGHALFTKIEEALSAKGYSYFVLDVLSGNVRAVDFYKKHGYEIVDERSVKLGEREYPLTVFRKKNLLIKS